VASMKLWVDVVHPKDAWLLKALLLDCKFEEVYVTSRRGLATCQVLDMLKISHTPFGRYGYSVREKFMFGVEREKTLAGFIESHGRPDVLYAHGSVEATRVAFGFGIPMVHANDTIINLSVLRLTVPLLDSLVTPNSIEKKLWEKFGIAPSKIIQYNGTEEVSYIKRRIAEDVPLGIDMSEKELRYSVVLRDIESDASYVRVYREKIKELLSMLAEDYQVIFLPRYTGKKAELKGAGNIMVPKNVLNVPLLVRLVGAVICSGGTIAKEAALQGTPAISLHFFDLIGKYLSKKGFPLYYLPNVKEAYKLVCRIMGERVEVGERLNALEDPVPHIIEQVHRLSALGKK